MPCGYCRAIMTGQMYFFLQGFKVVPMDRPRTLSGHIRKVCSLNKHPPPPRHYHHIRWQWQRRMVKLLTIVATAHYIPNPRQDTISESQSEREWWYEVAHQICEVIWYDMIWGGSPDMIWYEATHLRTIVGFSPFPCTARISHDPPENIAYIAFHIFLPNISHDQPERYNRIFTASSTVNTEYKIQNKVDVSDQHNTLHNNPHNSIS